MIKRVFNTDADRVRSVLDLPIGILAEWHSASPPPGWLPCIGQLELISKYQQLYNVMTANGTVFPFGPNVGSDFRMPDMQDRYIMSPTWSNNNPGSGYAATVGGTNQHSHTVTAKPTNTALSVSIPAGGSHTHNWAVAAVSNTGAHTHSGGYSVGIPNVGPNVGRDWGGNQSWAADFHSHGGNYNTSSSGGHNHNVSASSTVNSANHSHSISTSVNTNTTNLGNHNPLAMRVFYMVYAGVPQ